MAAPFEQERMRDPWRRPVLVAAVLFVCVATAGGASSGGLKAEARSTANKFPPPQMVELEPQPEVVPDKPGTVHPGRRAVNIGATTSPAPIAVSRVITMWPSERRDTLAPATIPVASQAAVLGTTFPSGDMDSSSSTGNLGDRARAATLTSFSRRGSNSTVALSGTDGTHLQRGGCQ